MLWHPEIAERDCNSCLEYIYDEKTGKIQLQRDGTPEKRSMYVLNGQEVCPAPCRTRKGCPKGTPEKPNSLCEANRVCYEHYQECKAVGQFPDDPIVRRNAVLISQVEKRFEQYEEQQRLTQMLQLSMLKAAGGQ